jgi:FkbH-like protein
VSAAGCKCVVWDLDNTLWEGVLLEDASVRLRAAAVDAIRTLDRRGILHSIASKNEHGLAMQALRRFQLDEFFLVPQIHWGSKAQSVGRIAEVLGIGLDAVAFVDDDPFERAEVGSRHPEVHCLDAADVGEMTLLPAMRTRFATDEARLRRSLYRAELTRREAETSFSGPTAEFLASLHLVFTVAEATRADLRRAEELTVRTHQLNTTGRTYSYQELDGFLQSPSHRLLTASLEDRFGRYGTIGLALVHCDPQVWRLQLLLMSCRVLSRGVGQVLLGHVVNLARRAGVAMEAELVPNGRNRMMEVTYRFAGFREVARDGEKRLLSRQADAPIPLPSYVQLRVVHRSDDARAEVCEDV